MSIYSIIHPVLAEIYGDGSMVEALAGHLAMRIANWPNDDANISGRSREDMIMQTCWNWFSGGDTAEIAAQRIEQALNGRESC